MTRLFFALLTLLFLSGPAIGGNSDYRSCLLAAKTTPALRIAPFDDLVTVAGGQRHHLNQTAAFRDVIPRGQGLSVEMQGNIFREAGAPHTLAHRSLEGFWNTFRGTDILEISPNNESCF